MCQTFNNTLGLTALAGSNLASRVENINHMMLLTNYTRAFVLLYIYVIS